MHLLTHVLIGFQKTISKYCSTKLSVVLKCHATRNVTITKEDLKRYGIFGWDVGRICFLARACCEMGYITAAEARKYIDYSYELAHVGCASWKDLAMSYVIGRSLWGERVLIIPQ